MQFFHLPRAWPWYLCGILLLTCVGSILLIPLRSTKLSELHWNQIPRLLVISEAERDAYRGTLLLRPTDGVTQFMPGDWKPFFSSNGTIPLVGEYPPGYTTSTGQQLYVFRTDGKVTHLNLHNVTSTISQVGVSSNNIYLSIETEQNSVKHICLMAWQESSSPPCIPLSHDQIRSGAWNPFEGLEFFLETTTGTIFSINPWELASQKTIDPEADQLSFNRAAALLKPHETVANNRIVSHVKKLFFRFFNVLLVQQGKRFELHRVPSLASLSWLFDADHILVKQQDALGVYELSTRSYAPLLTELGIGTKRVDYVTDGERTL